MSLWKITTVEGDVIEEDQAGSRYWPDIPTDVRIAKLEAAGHTFEGFDEYGLQRIGVAVPGGGGFQTSGFQVLCKSEVGVVLWTIERGVCHTQMKPINLVTYNPEYWRKGARDG